MWPINSRDFIRVSVCVLDTMNILRKKGRKEGNVLFMAILRQTYCGIYIHDVKVD